MQRPERVVLIAISAIACGIVSRYIGGDYKLFIPGIPFHVFETMSIFTMPIVVMAVLTNITAINRLRDAKKALDAKDIKEVQKEVVKQNEESRYSALLHGWLLLAGLLFLSPAKANPCYNEVATVDAQDTFPVPKNVANLMFYIQRTPNTNTICYELNVDEKGNLDADNPIHPFWLRYASENGKRAELNFIQRTFAYGLKAKKSSENNYELRPVAYSKKKLFLRKATDNKFHVYSEINNKQSILERIFIKIDGGTFWSPNVIYIELRGIDAVTGANTLERIKP
jgi:hypothetical protein